MVFEQFDPESNFRRLVGASAGFVTLVAVLLSAWHYYTAGRSLCGKWLQQHDDVLADDGQLRPRDCHACRRHLQQKGGAA